VIGLYYTYSHSIDVHTTLHASAHAHMRTRMHARTHACTQAHTHTHTPHNYTHTHAGAVKLMKYNEMVRSRGEMVMKRLRQKIDRFVAAMDKVGG
jgi:hypothetical protein